MQIKELIIESETVNEAQPMSFLSKVGNKVLSKVGGNMGAVAKGKLASGGNANQLMGQYQQWLGTIGEKPSKENLIQWLTDQGLPVDAAQQVVNTAPAPTMMQKVGGAVKGAAQGAVKGFQQAGQAPQPAPAQIAPVQTQSIMRDLINRVSESVVLEDTPIDNSIVSKAIMAAVRQQAKGQSAPTAQPAPVDATAPADATATVPAGTTPADAAAAVAPTSDETTPQSNQTTTNAPAAGGRIGAPAGKQAVDNAVQTVNAVRADRRQQVIDYAQQKINDAEAQLLAIRKNAGVKQAPELQVQQGGKAATA